MKKIVLKGHKGIGGVAEGEALVCLEPVNLMADTGNGRRPGFTGAALPAAAEQLFDIFVEKTTNTGLKVACGRFGAHMSVEIINDGPVTIMLDSRDKIGK